MEDNKEDRRPRVGPTLLPDRQESLNAVGPDETSRYFPVLKTNVDPRTTPPLVSTVGVRPRL